MKICSRCHQLHDRKHGWCLDCHNKNMQQWRKTHPLTEEQRKKDIARSYAGVYKRAGRIQKSSCETCGSKAEMHHPDYAQPLLIKWLCRKHHMELHYV